MKNYYIIQELYVDIPRCWFVKKDNIKYVDEERLIVYKAIDGITKFKSDMFEFYGVNGHINIKEVPSSLTNTPPPETKATK